MKKIFLNFIIVLSLAYSAIAQETYPRNDIADKRQEAYAFTNAVIYQNSNTRLENAILLIRKGKIEAVGQNVPIPEDVTVFDLNGSYIYPSFIEIHSSYGLPDQPARKSNPLPVEQIFPETRGAYNANDAIKSSYNAVEHFAINKDKAKAMRDLGFGAALTFMPDGICRGTSALVSLNDTEVSRTILIDRAATHFSFSRGSSSQFFPWSIMGSIALLRQTHFDAQWYQKQTSEQFYDETLEAYLHAQELPSLFSADNLLSLLRAGKLGEELGVDYVIKGSGEEYQKIEEVKALNVPLIVPINFPAAPKVDDPYEALDVSLEKMKHWELAPTNLTSVATNDIEFVITSDGLKDKGQFWPNLRKAIKYGLPEEKALKALTETPAKLIKAEDQLGQLKVGMLANFVICKNGIFTDSAAIHENWVLGERYLMKPVDSLDLSGAYELSLADTTLQLEVVGKPGKQTFRIAQNDTTHIKVRSKIEGSFINLNYSLENGDSNISISGWIEDGKMQGTGQLSDGTWVAWSAKYIGEVERKENDKDESAVEEDDKTEEKPEETVASDTVGSIIFPFVAYGNEQLPVQEDLLITNATVWTNESEGILEDADILIRDGRIARVGQDIKSSRARVIDASGKHVTSGIIDEHTHVALTAVNDVAVNSSLVRMKDAINPDDINIYRQIAGGVTAAQLLHGSANPIGGQSAIVKFKWGASASDMLIEGADKYIKFALGENVTRAGNPFSIRYPQSRMGVEQIYMDGFTRAKEYGERWKEYNALSSAQKARTSPPRIELDLEPLLEIIEGERFITCHSYVQSEINMLMKVADHFGFTVNTFTHILEGYKVADKMKAHGAGASTFSDWYNYKFEVIDAIPYNASIMNELGIVTAINSDDREMARRLNQEAAKSVKYGGMNEEDAWKMVTLNPARLLHLDDRMGSLKVGKDADVVIWSENPLSIYAKVETTIIDGTVYYDSQKDLEMRKWIAQERARLTQKIVKGAAEGAPMAPVPPEPNFDLHCDDLFLENR